MKTKSLNRIENKLEELEEGSYRYQVLDTCRQFKTSWIELGQSLYAVHRDKLFRDWGFVSFENYCSGELGIKHATASKLLKSYTFLEREEPTYLRKVKEELSPNEKYADLDAVDLLRKAKEGNKIDDSQYASIRGKVLDDAKDSSDVRKEIRMLSSRPEADPRVTRKDRRQQFLKKAVRSLENLKIESMANRFLPPKIIDQIDDISQKIEVELNG